MAQRAGLPPLRTARRTSSSLPTGVSGRAQPQALSAAGVEVRKVSQAVLGTHRHIFHGTKVSDRDLAHGHGADVLREEGVSAREIERMHGVTPETAWYMLHRLREAMKREPLAGMLSGTIVADET